jgi:arylformamidase
MVHYPGDPVVSVERELDIDRGDEATVSRVNMCAHSGTHVDAPAHFCAGGKTIDDIPFGAIIGKARVIEVHDHKSIKPSALEGYDIGAGEILLFKTRNSRLWKKKDFSRDFVHLSTEAAILLAQRKVSTVGIDYLSIGGFEGNEAEVHRILLEASVWIIEGLDLSAASAGMCDFICLPLRIAGCEAAPARAIIRALS